MVKRNVHCWRNAPWRGSQTSVGVVARRLLMAIAIRHPNSSAGIRGHGALGACAIDVMMGRPKLHMAPPEVTIRGPG